LNKNLHRTTSWEVVTQLDSNQQQTITETNVGVGGGFHLFDNIVSDEIEVALPDLKWKMMLLLFCVFSIYNKVKKISVNEGY
jgi:hypothetical protein